jgi:hypothetical protein
MVICTNGLDLQMNIKKEELTGSSRINVSGCWTVCRKLTRVAIACLCKGAVSCLINPISSCIPTTATAHAFEFSQVTSSAGEAWIDKNLGASQVATSSTDPASYGDLYPHNKRWLYHLAL